MKFTIGDTNGSGVHVIMIAITIACSIQLTKRPQYRKEIYSYDPGYDENSLTASADLMTCRTRM